MKTASKSGASPKETAAEHSRVEGLITATLESGPVNVIPRLAEKIGESRRSTKAAIDRLKARGRVVWIGMGYNTGEAGWTLFPDEEETTG